MYVVSVVVTGLGLGLGIGLRFGVGRGFGILRLFGLFGLLRLFAVFFAWDDEFALHDFEVVGGLVHAVDELVEEGFVGVVGGGEFDL